MFRADLHCHSTFSDGSETPARLLEMAKSAGLSGLSITDHDTIDAYPSAIVEAKKQGILLGSGVELSCAFQNTSLHLLGYDFSLENPALVQFCERHVQRRKNRNLRMLEKLRKYQMTMTEEELIQSNPATKTLGRPHIAKLMIEKGYVKTFKEAFNEYLGDGKKCYDPGEPFSAEETISVIHEARGKAFLAHPHLLDQPKIVDDLLKLPFDGIECRYAKFTPPEEKRWMKIAQSRNLLMSGGSDFHGGDKTYLPLGSSWVDEPTFHKIFQNLL
jgi:predicted metal-dependent phosphoesterase TrpH